ncbi:iron-siderophore ABC transporter substrate-binding protein [Pantanalinema rosaneae CENA516]
MIMMGAIVACQGTPSLVQHNAVSTPSAVPANCRTIAHAMGETQVCGQPQRIVVLGPYLLEPLLALGIQPIAFGDHIAFHQGDYTKPAEQIPYLGQWVSQPLVNVGIAYTPSIEAILKAQPDLILGIDGNNARQYQTLTGIAPTLMLKWTEPEKNLQVIAQAVNRSKQAEQLLTQTRQQIATARQAFAPLVETAPRLLLLSSTELREIYLGVNTHGMCSSLLKELGFQLVVPPGVQPSQQTTLIPITLEALPQLNHANLIVLLGNNFKGMNHLSGTDMFEKHQLSQLKQAWAKNAIAQTLNASKRDQVYFIPAYLCLGLPGPIGTNLYLNELQQQLLPSQ